MKKQIIFTGFMLFALFFGAGNLIFPPYLGMEAASAFWPAIIGFIATGVLLPLLAVIATTNSPDGSLLSISNRVHPWFGMAFAIIIYMSIGPFYAIPRAANIAYEFSWAPIIASSNTQLFIFSVIFFGISYFVSIRPQKIVDIVGRLLTPALLIVLAYLFYKSFTTFSIPSVEPIGNYAQFPFLEGFLQGYFTLDAIAALAFGIVVIEALRSSGITEQKQLMKSTTYAAMIAAFFLALVYLAIGWIGRVYPDGRLAADGSELLVQASLVLFGENGHYIFGSIVLLACLTTVIGLISAISQFFRTVSTRFSYHQYVIIFTLIGFGFTNFGLSTILSMAVPVLVFIYPTAIVLITLTLFTHWIGAGQWMYRLSVIIAVLFGAIDGINALDIQLSWLTPVLKYFPLYEQGLAWILPALLFALIGWLIDRSQAKQQQSL